jgi:hypothetical protein
VSLLAPLLAVALAAEPATTIPLAPRFASLQGGETLGAGGSEAVFSAGFSTVGATYAQGITAGSDLGANLEFDWLTTELFAGAFYRQLTWREGATYLSWRARVGLYVDAGSTWAVSSNRSDVGIRATPGLAVSRQFSRGVLSASLDVPFDVTFERGGGFQIGVRGAAAFETPLVGDFMAGARAGVGGLWSTAGAPFANDSPRVLVDVSVLLTYRLL